MKTNESKIPSLATLLAMTAVGLPLNAADFTVTRSTITGPGSLQAVVAQVNATPGPHVVRFGVSGRITLASSLPTITRDVTIEGRDGLEINGGGVAALFRFAPGVTASLSDLSLNGGSSTNGGSAVWNDGNLTIARCSFLGNRGGVYGGAVFNGTNATLFIRQSSFASNSVSPGWGGAIWNSGALAMVDSTVSANSSIGGDGEAGHIGGGGGAGFGGGLFVASGSSHLTNCTISGNLVRGGVGGESFFSSRSALGGGPFPGTGAAAGFGTGGRHSTPEISGQAPGFGGGRSGDISRGIFRSQGGVGMGGAFFAMSGSISMVNCTIVSNTCQYSPNPKDPQDLSLRGDAVGGGIYRYGGNVRMLNSIVQNNRAGTSPDLVGQFASDGYNLIGNNTGATGLHVLDYQNETTPLGPLQDNGGPNWTHALLAGGPAINGGWDSGAPLLDQRGYERPGGGAVDIGAVESDGKPAPEEPADPETLRLALAVELEALTVSGRRYQIEYTSDFASWTPVGPVVEGTGGLVRQLASTEGRPAGFWRLRRLP